MKTGTRANNAAIQLRVCPDPASDRNCELQTGELRMGFEDWGTENCELRTEDSTRLDATLDFFGLFFAVCRPFVFTLFAGVFFFCHRIDSSRVTLASVFGFRFGFGF